MIVFTVVIYSTKSKDDGAPVKQYDEDDPILKPKVNPITYVTPDIDPLIYSANNFDSDDAFEKKLIKTNEKTNDVKSTVGR